MKGDGEQYYSNEYAAVSARKALRFSVEANIRSLICTSRAWVPSCDSRATCSSLCIIHILRQGRRYCLFNLKFSFAIIVHMKIKSEVWRQNMSADTFKNKTVSVQQNHSSIKILKISPRNFNFILKYVDQWKTKKIKYAIILKI